MDLSDPNDRCRVDGDTQLKRDARVAELRAAQVPFRVIAARLGISLGSVQKALRRWQERQARLAELAADDDGDDDDVLGVPFSRLTDAELARLERVEIERDLAEDPDNALAKYRLRHLPR